MLKSVRIGLAINRNYGYYRSVLRGIVRFAETKPEWLFSSIIFDEWSLTGSVRTKAAGLIASIQSPEVAKLLVRSRRPIVNVSVVLPELKYPRVGVDNAIVGRQAADHFLERGLAHFGFIGPPHHLYSIERRQAFCQALYDAGFTLAIYETPADVPFDSLGQRWDLGTGFHRWLRSLPKPAGLFMPSDAWGWQIAEACRHVSLRVPEDVALLGVDDDDLDCHLTRPRLSSVIVPADRIGFEAAALLDRMLAGNDAPVKPILIPPSGIATRRSSETLAIDDPEVVFTVRFIREHAHVPLRVSDVLQQVPLGRRTLERRFQKAFGRGLADEIRRAHLELAQRLLVRTDFPMKIIALKAGFSDFRHMAVVFRQEVGISPTAYRLQHSQGSTR